MEGVVHERNRESGWAERSIFLLRSAVLAKKTHEGALKSVTAAATTSERTEALLRDARSVLKMEEKLAALRPAPTPTQSWPSRRWWIGAASTTAGAFVAWLIDDHLEAVRATLPVCPAYRCLSYPLG